MKNAVNKFYVLPYSGTFFNDKKECDIRVQHDLIEAVDIDEIISLIDEMIDRDDSLDTRTSYYRGYKKALTELKEKL